MEATKKWLSRIGNVLLTLFLITMALAFIISKASGGEPNVFGYQMKTVLSGSMEPTFMTGGIIAIDPSFKVEDLKKDDIITFKEAENKLVTHRITEVVDQNGKIMFRTKGDNNDTKDKNLVLSQNVVGVYTGVTIPYLGYFLDWANSTAGAVVLLVVPGILLLIYAGFSIWQAVSVLDKRVENTAENTRNEA